MKLDKKSLILVAALIIPGGLIALGLWKSYDLLKGDKKDEKNDKSE